ncbi:MAG: hypothetical protein A2W00_01165 [Candidatus Eisenbacteria bacterium RBG_16_71_46]|nr:MAG: hypothetical protein A2W00_01165 [Candidatus Eisenbacteria bacterium RBG_16_71_46]
MIRASALFRCLLCAAAAALPAAGAAVAAPAPVVAKGSRAFRLEHALTLRRFSDLEWSPDGRRLAFVATETDTAENEDNQDLWVLDAAGGSPLRLTRHPKADSSPTFSPGGDTLAFIANRGSGEDARSAVYMMSLRGGEPWPFGSEDESVTEVAWSPDGRTLAYVKLDTLPRAVRDWRKKKWDQVVEDERLQYPALWVVDVASGAKRRLTSGPRYVWYLRWSPDGRSIAFLVSPTGKPDDANLADVGIVPAGGGRLRTLGVIGAAFTWSPDGKWIALATSLDREVYVQKTDLYAVPVAGGAPRNLTAGDDLDADTPEWNVTSDTLYFHAARGASSVVAAVPLAGGGVRLAADREAQAGALVASSSGRVAWVQSQPTRPDEIWLAERPGLAGRPATALNAGIEALALGHTRAVRWTSTDGVQAEGLLLRPPGSPERGALKTLVLLHGGPYGSRYALGFQSTPQVLAARGYQIFMPNFRASGGYGTAFMVRERADWGGQDWRDVSSGVDSLVRWGLADGRRLGVFGGSYGGYLSAWAITQTRRFDAACVIAGAEDLASFYGQSDIHRYRAFEFGGFPWQTPERWARSSPSTYIEAVRTPTLILIGENDRRVPYPQAQQLYQALRDLGVPTEFVHYPREGHGLREPHHRADQLIRLLAWFDRWVR